MVSMAPRAPQCEHWGKDTREARWHTEGAGIQGDELACTLSSPGCAARTAASTSRDGTSFACDQLLSSKGMNSMKRMSMGRCFASAL
jgi:hypothetical protein